MASKYRLRNYQCEAMTNTPENYDALRALGLDPDDPMGPVGQPGRVVVQSGTGMVSAILSVEDFEASYEEIVNP